MDSIIAGVKEFLNGCDALQAFSIKNRHIDWTDEANDNYGIMPDGEKTISKFLTGGGKRQYNFTLYVNKLSEGDAQRLKNAELLERVQTWCAKRTRDKKFPVLPEGCTPTKITAENAMLLEIGKSRNKYQIQFTLMYIRR